MQPEQPLPTSVQTCTSRRTSLCVYACLGVHAMRSTDLDECGGVREVEDIENLLIVQVVLHVQRIPEFVNC
jgi:hypothetical protein